MADDIFKGSTGHRPFFQLTDSTTGLGKTGVAAASVAAYYTRQGAAPVAITVAALATVSTAFTGTGGGGWFEYDSVKAPGLYRLDVPDAAFATGSDEVVVTVVVTGAISLPRIFSLVNWNNQTDAIPNASAGAAGGLPLGDASGRVLLQPAQAGVTIPTVSTLTGHTPQSGDSFPRIGAGGSALVSIGDTRLNFLDASIAAAITAITAIQNNTSTRLVVAPLLEIPDTGSTVYEVNLLVYDEVGNMVAPTSLPTITVRNAAGTDRSANLSAVTLISVGKYKASYTLLSSAVTEQLTFEAAVVRGGQTRNIISIASAVNDDVTGTAAKVNLIYADYQQRSAAVILPTGVATSAAQVTAQSSLDNIAGKTGNLPSTPASQGDVLSVQADTANIKTRLPAVLVAGRMSSSVGAIADDTITEAAIAADAIDAAALKSDAVTKLQSGLAKTSEVQLTVNPTPVTVNPTPVSGGFLDADRTKLENVLERTGNLPDDPAGQADLIAAIDAINVGAGTGARTMNFTVVDSHSAPIENVIIRLVNGINQKREKTGPDGTVSIPVDDATWRCACDLSGYDGQVRTLIVNADADITIVLTAIVIPISTTPGKVMLWIDTTDFGDLLVGAKFTLRVPSALGEKNVVMGSAFDAFEPKEAVSGEDGRAFWEVPASADLPLDAKSQVRPYFVEGDTPLVRKRFIAPSGGGNIALLTSV